jgi:MFS family permease
MSAAASSRHPLASLTRDGRLLFAARIGRLFAYGLISVVLVLYLAQLGYSETQIGVLLTLTLIGDVAISLWLTTRADRIGRRRMLMIGAGLMLAAGAVFAFTGAFWLLLLAATIGVISPSGNEVGPFLPIEQAALSHVVGDEHRTGVFAWYNLVGSFATALGALCGGWLAGAARHGFVRDGMEVGLASLYGYRIVILAYAAGGLLLLYQFWRLSPAVEVDNKHLPPPSLLGLPKSRKVVLKLSGLFALDAFGGGFVIQAIVAGWFHVRFGAPVELIGTIFFGANILAGVSALSATWLAKRIGLINTMVFTHLPSNVLLILVPLMPNLTLAIVMLLLRFSISQMDVPTRQSYTMAVVTPEERSAAAGVTGVARSVGAALSPLFTGYLQAASLLAAPFFISGGLKIVYDLLLYRAFSKSQAEKK